MSLLSLMISCHKNEDIKIHEERIVSASLDKIILEDTTQIVANSFTVDLNNDLLPDYRFYYSINYHYEALSYIPFYMYIETYGANELLINNDYENPSLQLMKSGYQFTGRWANAYASITNYPQPSQWEGAGPSYMGFRIKKNNKFSVGWLKMEIGKKGNKIVLYDYALRLDNANQMIAGQR